MAIWVAHGNSGVEAGEPGGGTRKGAGAAVLGAGWGEEAAEMTREASWTAMAPAVDGASTTTGGDGGGVLARRRRGTRRRRVATAVDEVWTWKEGQLDGEEEGMEEAAGSSPEMEVEGKLGE